MANRDLRVLEKILAHIETVLRYCENCASLADFQNNSMLVEATVFNLMQIGELAKNALSDSAREQITTIPWTQIYGMRNRIVHGYSGINLGIVWETVKTDLPMLQTELTELLKTLN